MQTFKYILIGLYVFYVLVMLAIFIWGDQRMIFLGGIFFPVLIIAQVYYVLRAKEKGKPKDQFNDWYQNK